MLALALALTLAALPPDAPGDPDGPLVDPEGLLEAVLRRDDRLRRAPVPCEERIGWLGDDDPREPPPCDDDDGLWLVGPAPGDGDVEGD